MDVPIERLLGIFKGYVVNRARLESSIAEAYIVKECLTFCSIYLGGIETVFNKEEINGDGGDVGMAYSVFSQKVHTFGLMQRALDVSENERKVAQWFVLYNSPEIDKYLEEHKNQLQNANVHDITRRQQEELPRWFKERINQLRAKGSSEATDELWSLANGPGPIVNIYSGSIYNGIRFHTKDRDNRRTSQNSGVVV